MDSAPFQTTAAQLVSLSDYICVKLREGLNIVSIGLNPFGRSGLGSISPTRKIGSGKC